MNPLDIIVMQEDFDPPDEEFIYYAATQKGWLVNTPTLFGAAQVLSKDYPAHLPEAEERFLLNGTKLPLHMLTQFHDFARKNFDKRHAECSAYLTYNDTTGDFRLFIPEQYVSHTSVNHKLDPGQIKNGYRAIGTIHSHCDFGAFHSGTDKHDMGKMPGLHITIGHVNTDTPEYAFAFSIADNAFSVRYDQIVDVEKPLDVNGYATAPDHWLRFVNDGQAPWGYAGGIRTNYTNHKGYKKPTSNYNHTSHASNCPCGACKTKEPHWSEWSDDDYNWYQQTGTMQQHLFAGQQENVEAFEKHAEDVENSEKTMESEAFFLALKGFVLGYNITYNPKRAEQWLNKQGVFYEVGDDTPLLPELTEAPNGSTDTSQ